MIDKSVRISRILGTLIILFMAVILITNIMLFAIGMSLSGLTVLFAGIITTGIGWGICNHDFKQNPRQIFVIIIISLFIIIVVTTLINSIIYDISFDGQTYHSEAIISLANGWNPLRMSVPANVFYRDWVGFFSKGPWITAAAMYRFTENIETGKVFNSLLLVASGFFSYSAFSTFPQLNQRWRVNLSLLMMFNPVSVCQLFTFYVDGQLASCLIILVSLLIIVSQQQPNKIYLLAVAAVLLIITNVKLTGILYAGILISGFVIWYGWQFRKQAMPVFICCISASVIGIFVIGYNPIISQFTHNLIEKGDPFYPVSWTQLIAIDRNIPQDFTGKDRFWKLAVSLFSKSQVSRQAPQLKIPFTLSVDELFEFRYPDVRSGGFGPLFGGALLLSVLILVIGLVQHRKTLYKGFIPILLLLIVISVLSTSETWWARYIPQLWTLPILIVAFSIRNQSNRLSRGLIGIWAFVLALNIILVSSVSIIAMLKDQQMLQAEYDTVKQIEKDYGAVPLVLNVFPITQARFEQHNITFTLTDKLPCSPEQQHILIYSWSAICDPDMQANSQ